MKLTVRIVLVVMLTAVMGCMATRFSDVWVDESYRNGPVSDVLVMASFPSQDREKMVEDEMAKQLRLHGVNAVLGYAEFPGKQPGEEAVLSGLNKPGISTVLMVKFVRTVIKSSGNLQPGDPYYDPQLYAVIETSLYDTETRKKIWTARSETWVVGTNSRLTSSFVSDVVKKLAADKLVR